jgi:hypothetical protein
MKNSLLTICLTIALSPAFAVDPANPPTTIKITPEMQKNMMKFQKWYQSPDGQKKSQDAQKAWKGYVKKNPQAIGVGKRAAEASQDYAKKHDMKNFQNNANEAFKKYMEQRKQSQQ